MHPPPPPSISPSQMTLLRIVSTMAWSDGHLADEEVEVMLDQFSGLFANNPDHQQALRTELRDYMMQNIPLEELTPKLTSAAERELVLKLGYQVISASSRTPDENLINQQEADAYQKLVTLLDLPEDVVAQVEQSTAIPAAGLVDHLTDELRHFIQGD
ncbi:TerB family tellurite resistance protein [Nodosilinea sp. P-1105]|nr:TerB family tellurite resistance protein [Nodosilinea sp. P-1105]